MFSDKTIHLIKSLHAEGYNHSAIASKIIEQGLDDRSHRTIRLYVSNVVKDIDDASELPDDNYSDIDLLEEHEKTSLEKFCKDRSIPFDKIKRAKYITNNNQDTWNIDLFMDSELTFGETVVEKLSDTFKTISPLQVVPSETNDKAIMIFSSDKHAGADSDGGLFGNDYNAEVYMNRINDITIRCYNEKMLHGKFDLAFIGDLGDGLDGLDGKTTRGGHTLPQNMSNEESFETFVKGQKKMIDDAISMDLANNYVYWAIACDNHSGIFAYTANRLIEEYIKAKYPFVDVKVQTKFIEHYIYGTHTYIFSHGKDDKYRKFGMPLNLDKKTEDLIGNYITYNKLKGTIHFVKGDLHQSAVSNASDESFDYRNVPSMYGGSGYVQTNYGLCTPSTGYEITYKHTNRVTRDEIIHA